MSALYITLVGLTVTLFSEKCDECMVSCPTWSKKTVKVSTGDACSLKIEYCVFGGNRVKYLFQDYHSIFIRTVSS